MLAAIYLACKLLFTRATDICGSIIHFSFETQLEFQGMIENMQLATDVECLTTKTSTAKSKARQAEEEVFIFFDGIYDKL